MGAKNSKKSYNVVEGQQGTPSGAAYIPQSTISSGQPVQTDQSTSKKMTSSSGDEGHVEGVVCSVNDMENGQMKEVELEGKKILLVKEEDQFYAVGSKCTHYGAPLVKGAYCKGIVRCPWHGACFSVKSGDIEDFPGLDSLPKFQTQVEGDRVRVTASRDKLGKAKWTKQMCKFDQNLAGKGGLVIIGGGAAAVSCAESARQEGYSGTIRILSQEPTLPYDRPKISKALDIEVENIYMRTPDFYKENDIEVLVNSQVISVDPPSKSVALTNGSSVQYEVLMIATGGKPRELTCPGADLKNVCYLRTPADGAKIAAFEEGKNVVVVGSSFIGMELAACMKPKGKGPNVTLVGRDEEPLGVFGPKIGAAFKKLHESNGIKFHMNSGLKELRGNDGILTEAVLSDGTVILADLCVVGIGVVPATDFLRGSGIDATERGFLIVDDLMRTNLEGIYACGDIVSFPLSSFGGKLCNVQHWQMALKHGKTAGMAIAGKKIPVNTVPFFWSVMFGKSVRYAGYGAGHDDIITKGDVDDLKFVAYYLKSGKVVAVATLARDPVAAQIAEVFRLGKTITADDVMSNEKDDWTHLLV